MVEQSDKQPIYKKWWFWAIIALVVLIGVGVAAGSNQNGNTDTDITEMTPQDTPDDQLSGLAIGASVTIDGITVTVNSVADGPLALMDTTPTYDVNVTYKNNSGSSITISPYDWMTVLRTGSDKAHVGGDTSFSLATLEDGEEWTGIVNLWADDDPIYVAFESSYLNLAGDDKRATWLIEAKE